MLSFGVLYSRYYQKCCSEMNRFLLLISGLLFLQINLCTFSVNALILGIDRPFESVHVVNERSNTDPKPGEIIGMSIKETEDGQLQFVKSDTILLDRGFTLKANFKQSIGNSGGMPTWVIKMKSNEKSKKNSTFIFSSTCLQPTYCQENRLASVLDAHTFEFEWIPFSTTLVYESHLEYIPHLNIIQWMLSLPEGAYTLELQLGKKTPLARGEFTLVIDNQTRSQLWKKYEALYYSKVSKVTFPIQSCQNKINSIQNPEALTQYGNIIKLDYEIQTANLVDWNDPGNTGDYIFAFGYGIFDRFGRYELIPLKFRKENEDDQFMFYGLGEFDMDLNFKCEGSSNISPRLLRYGFEMKKYNIYNCTPW